MNRTILITSTALALLATPVNAGSTAVPADANQQFTQAQLDYLSQHYTPTEELRSHYTRSGAKGIALKLSGQVNRGVMFTDDGNQSQTFFVDNDNSSTRLRFTGDGDVGKSSVGVIIEVEIQSNPSNLVSQNAKTINAGGFTERKLEFWAKTPFGKIWVGQGDMASNGTAEQDVSATTAAGYSGVPFVGGGLFFLNQTAHVLSPIRINNAFSNLDGQSRRDRVRYDTPTFGGFYASASAGEGDRQDVALHYSGTLGDFHVKGAAAYSDGTNDDTLIDGSVSVLHTPSGVSLTFAAGHDNLAPIAGPRTPTYTYVKAGWQTNAITGLGTTGFSVDYYDGQDFAAIGDSSMAYGFLAVQHIGQIGTEIYAGVRNFQYSAPGAISYHDITVALVGGRVKF